MMNRDDRVEGGKSTGGVTDWARRDFGAWVLADIGILTEVIIELVESCLFDANPAAAFLRARQRCGAGAPTALSVRDRWNDPGAAAFFARLAFLHERADHALDGVLSNAILVHANRALWAAATERGVRRDALTNDQWQWVRSELRDVWAAAAESARERYRLAQQRHVAALDLRRHLRLHSGDGAGGHDQRSTVENGQAVSVSASPPRADNGSIGYMVPPQTEPLIAFADWRAAALLKGSADLPDDVDDLLRSTFDEPFLRAWLDRCDRPDWLLCMLDAAVGIGVMHWPDYARLRETIVAPLEEIGSFGAAAAIRERPDWREALHSIDTEYFVRRRVAVRHALQTGGPQLSTGLVDRLITLFNPRPC